LEGTREKTAIVAGERCPFWEVPPSKEGNRGEAGRHRKKTHWGRHTKGEFRTGEFKGGYTLKPKWRTGIRGEQRIESKKNIKSIKREYS